MKGKTTTITKKRDSFAFYASGTTIDSATASTDPSANDSDLSSSLCADFATLMPMQDDIRRIGDLVKAEVVFRRRNDAGSTRDALHSYSSSSLQLIEQSLEIETFGASLVDIAADAVFAWIEPVLSGAAGLRERLLPPLVSLMLNVAEVSGTLRRDRDDAVSIVRHCGAEDASHWRRTVDLLREELEAARRELSASSAAHLATYETILEHSAQRNGAAEAEQQVVLSLRDEILSLKRNNAATDRECQRLRTAIDSIDAQQLEERANHAARCRGLRQGWESCEQRLRSTAQELQRLTVTTTGQQLTLVLASQESAARNEMLSQFAVDSLQLNACEPFNKLLRLARSLKMQRLTAADAALGSRQ